MHDPHVLTLGAVAQRLGCPIWKIRRLFERGLVPPAARVGAYRIVAAADLPLIESALRAAGYLPTVVEASDVSE